MTCNFIDNIKKCLVKFSVTKLEKLGVLTAINFAFDFLRKTIYIMHGGHRAGVFLMMHFRGHIDYKPLMRGIFSATCKGNSSSI